MARRLALTLPRLTDRRLVEHKDRVYRRAVGQHTPPGVDAIEAVPVDSSLRVREWSRNRWWVLSEQLEEAPRRVPGVRSALRDRQRQVARRRRRSVSRTSRGWPLENDQPRRFISPPHGQRREQAPPSWEEAAPQKAEAVGGGVQPAADS